MPECHYVMSRNLLRQMLRLPDLVTVEKIVLIEDDPSKVMVYVSGDVLPEGEVTPIVHMRTDPTGQQPAEYLWQFKPIEQSEDKDAS